MLISGNQLEVLYGEEDLLGRSFLRRMAHKTAKVTRKVSKPISRVAHAVARNPIAKAALYVNPITASAMLAPKVIRAAPKVARVVRRNAPISVAARVTGRVVRRAAPVATRYTRKAVKAAAPIARQALKSGLVRSAAASFIPGGTQALSLYQRLTAAKKSIIPGLPSAARTQAPAPSKAPHRKAKAWKQRSHTPTAPAAQPRSRSAAPVAETPAPEGLSKYKMPIAIGGGVAALAVLGLILKGKK